MERRLSFPLAISLLTGLVSALLLLLAALARPWGVRTGVAAGLALATLFLAGRGVTLSSRGRRAGVFLLLSVQVGFFLLTIAGVERIAPFRLLQVAVVACYLGIGLAVVLCDVRGLAPGAALIPAGAVALAVFAVEAVMGLVTRPPKLELRPEWDALLAPGHAADSSDSSEKTPPLKDSPESRFFTGETAETWFARVGAEPPVGLQWSGRADPHPSLGIVFHPHSTLKTYYLEDPRHSFERRDFRERTWTLEVMPGSAAAAEFPPGNPDVVRIAITRANRDTLWHIHLGKPHLGLESRAPYGLEFRARADRPRTIFVAVSQAHAPWAGLGLYERVELTPEWRSFRQNFFAARSDRNARVSFELAGSDASVEISSVVLRGPHEGQPIEPKLPATRYFVGYRFDSLGCRGRDYPIPRVPSQRILLLGDGFTLGVGVREEATFAKQLEAAPGPDGGVSADSGRHREVINCGVAGYGTREARLFYQLYGARYQPDLVLLVMGLDDDRSYWERALRESRQRPGRLANLSVTWRAVRDRLRERRRFDYERCLEDIRQLDRDVRAQGGRLAIAILPTDADRRWPRLAAAISKGLERSAIPILALDRPLLDSLDEGARRVDASDGHPNELVHRAAAQELLKFLRQPGLSAAGRGR